MERIREISWGPGLFLVIYQSILLLSLPFYFWYAPLHLSTFISGFILLYLTGLSITAGYHRYFSHKSFKTNPVIEFFLLFFGSAAGQGSALRWCYDHRNHHAFVDTDKDPYCIKKGFWYAHFTWIFDKQSEIEPKMVGDLMRKPMIMVQHNHYVKCMVASNLLLFALTGWLCKDYLGAFVIGWWFRFFLLHHFTWFINSLAHTWGDKPFCEDQTAVNNFVISMLTFGEGYHNYHHVYANDYRNGIRWYHFDPTKWLIWTLNKCGLAHELKRVDPTTINKRMVLERKNLLLSKLRTACDEKRAELEITIQALSDQLIVQINQFNEVRKEYATMKQSKEMTRKLKSELKQLKKRLQADWRIWSDVSRYVMRIA
jgi:stearoyl-CoA desaturase (delta-9 desaturase)